ncbi:MAG: hypothetical protein F6K24_02470 [Okeania sp. SIO2D1]|nr:hypothetical protein [Okeania sp. SIO2D1]
MVPHLQKQQERVRTLQAQLQKEQELLEDLTKISALAAELAPILAKHPADHSKFAELLGLSLPTSTSRVIEIVDGDRKDEQNNVVYDTQTSKYAESSNCLDESSLDNQTDLPTTENASKDVDVTWYNPISGEVSAGSEKRYFCLLWNSKHNIHQVGLKKSESAKRWSKDINPTTQPLIDAVWQEFKAGKPAENFIQKLYEAAEEVGGKFTGSLCNLGSFGSFHLNESFGVFHILNEDIEVGHSEGNFWYIRPDRNKVYFDWEDGSIFAFTQCLKGLKVDKPQLKVAENTQIETAEIVDVATAPTVTWYNSSTGEVKKGSFKRYFRIIPDDIKDEHEIKFKKSTNSGNWIQPDNSTKLFAEAIWEEFKAGKPDAAEAILQRLYDVPEEVGGKFVKSHSSCTVGKLGTFYIPYQGSIEVGYNDGSYWYFRPGYEKVYYSGDVHEFAEILTGLVKKEPPISNSSKIETAKPKSSDCWYTPPEIVELVELVLGKIDLDPCSDDGKHIPAKLHYTTTEDGLNQQWQGKVFINPPYSSPGKWIEKLLSEIDSNQVTEAIALVPASTDTKWFAPLWNQPICFWKGRIKFLDTNYQPKLPARQSHCLVYWGENADKFNEIFSEYGEVKTSINSQSTEVETITPLIKQLEPLVSEKWVLEATEEDKVTVYETDKKNSDWVIITDRHESQGIFFISHETNFSNHAKTIEEAIERAAYWFSCRVDILDAFIEVLNSYSTDLTIVKNDSSIAYIQRGQETLGTIFCKDDETLEIAEREKQLFRDTYSIDIDNLIEDIQSQGGINLHDYLMGIGKLEVAFTKTDIIQNALYSLSTLNELVIVRQRDIFKFYNDDRLGNWLEENLGTIKIIDSGIVVDEELNHLLLNQYSILINQLITDIFNEKSEINSEDYIISNPTIKELVVKEVWDDKDFETANQMLNELAESSPVLNQLNEVKNQQLLLLNEDENIEVEDFYLIECDDDDPTWMDAIKAEIEKIEGFKVTHDEVYLTVTHYGTGVGSIQHLDCILEIQPKLINELAKHDLDLEAFLVSADIPYRLDNLLKPVVVTPTENSNTQTAEQVKKPQSGSITGNKPDYPKSNANEANAFE